MLTASGRRARIGVAPFTHTPPQQLVSTFHIIDQTSDTDCTPAGFSFESITSE